MPELTEVQYVAAARALLGIKPEHTHLSDDLAGSMVQEVCDPAFFKAALAVAFEAGRESAATAVERMPTSLTDEAWDALAGKAVDAGYDEAPVRRRQRDDRSFTHATIQAAYQYGYRTAAEVARG